MLPLRQRPTWFAPTRRARDGEPRGPEIRRLQALPSDSPADRAIERDRLDETSGPQDAAAVRADEIVRYGANATWAHTDTGKSTLPDRTGSTALAWWSSGLHALLRGAWLVTVAQIVRGIAHEREVDRAALAAS
jgi:hypothetical protein